MDLEGQVGEAIIDELTRQSDAAQGALTVSTVAKGRLQVQGEIDLEALAIAIVGTVAGGP